MFKRGDVVDVIWYPENPRCDWDWNGIAVVTSVHTKPDLVYCVRLIHNGNTGGFHEKDLRLLGHIELPEPDGDPAV